MNSGMSSSPKWAFRCFGHEEDPANSFATVAMHWMRSEFSDRVLTEAAKVGSTATAATELENSPVIYYDAHSLRAVSVHSSTLLFGRLRPGKVFAPRRRGRSSAGSARELCQGELQQRRMVMGFPS